MNSKSDSFLNNLNLDENPLEIVLSKVKEINESPSDFNNDDEKDSDLEFEDVDQDITNNLKYCDNPESDGVEEFYDLDEFDMSPHLFNSPCTSAGADSNSNTLGNGLEKLLLKQKIELTQELRGLQFSNRPVTGRESRTRLEQFFSNAVATQGNSSTIVQSTSTPSQFRSSTVANELAELNSRQRVSNVLTTATREEIERTLQRSRPNQSSATDLQMNPALRIDHRLSQPVPQPPPLPTNPTTTLPLHINPNRREPWLAVNSGNNLVEQLTREQIIGEISELVHRHVVSSTLQSEFRTNLENQITQRLTMTGTDGQRTRQLIRQLARTNENLIIRNDFSHLGIQNRAIDSQSQVGDLDNLDSASSLNEQRTLRSTLRNTKEIKELKTEIKELKTLLKLSFELQLDMQRSLKQEINALISNTFQNSASASLITSSRPTNEGSCLICTEAQVDTVFYACGHMCACYLCSMNLKQKNHNCPVCRAPIKDIIRTYKSNPE